jgi:hypothetical protein
MRHAVAVGIELNPEIFVDQRFHRVAVIIGDHRQWTQRFRLETIDGPLSGFAMLALIGDFDQPLPCLAIHIVKIGELAQRPEVLMEVSNGAFDFSLFPSAGGIAGSWEEAVFASESEEAWMEADQATVMFGDRRREVLCAAVRYVE